MTAQESTWLKRFGGQEENIVSSTVLTPAGDMVMTGSFIYGDGRMPLGNVTLKSEAPADFRCGFIAKFNAEGQVIWGQVLRSNRFGSIEELVLDTNGNLYVIGRFHGILVFGDQTYTENSYSPRHFLAKYDASGKPLWLKYLPGELTAEAKLCIDKQDNLYIACSQGKPSGNGIETRALVLYKFDSNGALLQENLIASVNPSNPAYIRDIIVDANQQPIISGQFMNSMKIGDQLFEGRSMADCYLVKFNADGAVKWARHVGKGERFSSIMDMTLDSRENIYLAGRFANKSDQIDLVLRINTEGEQTQRFSVARNVDTFYMGGIAGSAIKISNKDQAIILAGHFREKVAFGNIVLDSQRGENEYDVFLTKINVKGEITGVIQSNGDGTSSAINLGLTPTDHLYLVGHTLSSTFRFPNQLATKPTSNWDIFLYKLHIKMLETAEESQPDPGNEAEPEPTEYQQVIIPNIFTPNGDTKNQFFEIVHLDLSQNNTLVIFNRWGKQVYQSKSYQNNWEAEGLAEGTYYYVLYLEKESKYVKGWVSVVR
ncbi:hypothetical protein A3841_05805 [Pontibacter flavimaris]|uniref:Gliding motility-associated C-terminal domain-containing protein n=1 Tax=Pontibacter flavimaris TaxID=1797110 RepID=A0A1Q5P8T5_9BACT|nr:hypothetical protein A3841_05805 [Pontibacter flavimaris]